METTPAGLTGARPAAFFHLALSSESRAEALRHRLEQAAERPVAGAGQGEGVGTGGRDCHRLGWEAEGKEHGGRQDPRLTRRGGDWSSGVGKAGRLCPKCA